MRLSILISFLLTFSAFSQTDSTIVLHFGGDCLMAGHYEDAAGTNPDMAFRDFKLFHTSDVAMVNLECCVTTRGEPVAKPYNFRMRPSYLGALKRGGITLLNLANNHIFDYGNEGLFDTIDYLDSAGVDHVGAGRNREEAHTPVYFEKAGIKIGFMGYYEGGEAPAATANEPGVATRTVSAIRADIRRMKERDGADFVILTFHWGVEKADTVEEWQRQFAHRAIRAGADLIVGHHPHVLQGIERYRGGVIAYSLGNFIFGGNSRHTYRTAVLEVRLNKSGEKYKLIPVQVRRWRASVLRGGGGEEILTRVRTLSEQFSESIF
jgi:poly-gamma-glutamate synthesis protein (capsule biosynthesis protein)